MSAATKLNTVLKAPFSSRATKRALPPSAMTYQIFAFFMALAALLQLTGHYISHI